MMKPKSRLLDYLCDPHGLGLVGLSQKSGKLSLPQQTAPPRDGESDAAAKLPCHPSGSGRRRSLGKSTNKENALKA
jgi:hypothetical protein